MRKNKHNVELVVNLTRFDFSNRSRTMDTQSSLSATFECNVCDTRGHMTRPIVYKTLDLSTCASRRILYKVALYLSCRLDIGDSRYQTSIWQQGSMISPERVM